MTRDIKKFLILFLLIFINSLIIIQIVQNLINFNFLFQLFFVTAIIITVSIEMILSINNVNRELILLNEIIFLSFLFDGIYLIFISKIIYPIALIIISIIGLSLSLTTKTNYKSRVLRARIKSRDEEINKELDDEWKEKPKLIIDN